MKESDLSNMAKHIPEGRYVDLEDSLRMTNVPNIETTLQCCNDYVSYYATLEFCDAHGLTKAEGVTILLYTYDNGPENMTNNIYYKINFALSRRSNLTDLIWYILHLLKALRKLPCYVIKPETALYRVQRGGIDINQYTPGTQRSWPAFTSASRSKTAIQDFISKCGAPLDPSKSAIFEITGRPVGYDISELTLHKGEEEVLIEPETVYTVTSVEKDSFIKGMPLIRVQVVPKDPIIMREVAMFAKSEGDDRKAKIAAIQHIASQGAAGGSLTYTELAVAPPLLRIMNKDTAAELLADKGVTAYSVANKMKDPCAWCPEAFRAIRESNLKWAPIVTAFTRKIVHPLSELYKNQVNKVVYQMTMSSQGAWLYTEIACSNWLPCGLSKAYTKSPEDTAGGRCEYPNTKVHVMCSEAMYALEFIQKSRKDARIGFLNVGNQSMPGGTWNKPVTPSLEENLFMCTTISSSLEKYLYPLSSAECVYTEDVFFLRSGLAGDFRFLPQNQCFRFDVFTVAAYNLMRNGKTSQFTDDLILKTQAKLSVGFARCVERRRNVLILNALGCGAFANPPQVIATVFKALITAYAGYFEDIYFPIYNPQTANVFASVLTGCGGGVNLQASEVILEYPRLCQVWAAPPYANSNNVCPLGGMCPKINDPSHAGFAHPPPSVYGSSCTQYESILRLLFSHPPLPWPGM